MKILFLGVIVGGVGRRAAMQFIPDYIASNGKPDLIVVNANHAAEGSGLTGDIAVELLDAGINAITMGQDVWAQSDLETSIEKRREILRPLNLPETNPGGGILITDTETTSTPVALINLSGYTFIKRILPDNPFSHIQGVVRDVSSKARVTIIDFFAVPSAEKAAMKFYLDGTVSLLVGTGTLVQTADEQISKTGTASITDVGMIGAYDSVVGFEKEGEIMSFTTSMRRFSRTAGGRARVDALVCEVDPESGWAISIRRISEIIET